MNGHKKRREDKKLAILNTSFELFTQYGFDRVTIAEIAEKAHVSKVSIYNFFESKENLRRILIKDILDKGLMDITTVLKKKSNIRERMNEFIKYRVEYVKSTNFQLLFDGGQSDPEIKKSITEHTAAYRQVLMDFIEEGQKTKAFSSDISRTAIAIFIDIFMSYYENPNQNKTNLNLLQTDPVLSEELNMLFWDGFIRD